jgi:hypothetical protein
MHRLQLNRFARRSLVLSGVIIGLSLLASDGRSQSGDPDAAKAADTAWLPLDQALQVSRQTGRIVVVVTSSRAEHLSTAFVAIFKEVVSVAATDMAPVFAEMPLERYRAELKRIGVTTHPTLIIYRPGPRSIELVGSQSGFQSVREAFGWLDSIGALRSKNASKIQVAQPQTDSLAPPLPKRTMPSTELNRRDRDPELKLTGGQPPHQSGQLPSGQAPYPSEQGGPPTMPPPMAPPKAPPSGPPQYTPPAYPPPPQASYPPAQPVAPVTGMVSTPVVVSPPQVPVVIQPQAPMIVVGPTPQPNIIFAASPPSAPTLSYMVQGGAPVANAPTANAPQQIFMANAPQPTANAPQPVAMAPQPPAMAPQPVQMAMAPQPQPMAMAPQPQPVAMAPQPQPVAMAPQPQPVAMAPQVGQSPALLAAVLTNPSLFNRLVGAFGEHLAQRRNPRIQMGQAPQMMQAPVGYAPTGNAPGGGMAYAPLGYGGAPPMMGYLAVPAGGGQPPAYGYGYGYGPPPGQGYYPPPGYGYGPPPGQGYPPYPPQGPPEYPSYPPQGPPPVAPTPQGYNQGSWNGVQNWRPQQPSGPSNQSQKKGLFSHFWGD